MKKDPLLFVLMCIVGVFAYFAAFKGVVHIWMIPIMLIVLGLWYVTAILVTKKMIAKTRNGESFFFARAGLINESETEIISGAIAVTKSEIVFYKRKGFSGGVKVIWSCFTSEIESYSIGLVDDKHYGISLDLKDAQNAKKIVCSALKKRKDEFLNNLEWVK